jgi:hypothetical protein
VNLCDFYPYKLIGKLTGFLQLHLEEHTSGQFNFRRESFSVQFKTKIVNILTKATALRITLNIDDATVASRSHTHPSHSQTSRLLTSSLSLGVPVPLGTQYM